MGQPDFFSHHFNNAIHLLAASGGRRQYRQSGRECASACACSLACPILVIGIMGLLIGTFLFGYGLDLVMIISGILLLAIGVLLLVSNTREKRRIYAAMEGRDGVRVDAISSGSI